MYLVIYYVYFYFVFFWLFVFLIVWLFWFSIRSVLYCYFVVYCGFFERVYVDDLFDRLCDESVVFGSIGVLLSNDRVWSFGRDGEEEIVKIILEVVYVLVCFFWKKVLF